MFIIFGVVQDIVSDCKINKKMCSIVVEVFSHCSLMCMHYPFDVTLLEKKLC